MCADSNLRSMQLGFSKRRKNRNIFEKFFRFVSSGTENAFTLFQTKCNSGQFRFVSDTKNNVLFRSVWNLIQISFRFGGIETNIEFSDAHQL